MKKLLLLLGTISTISFADSIRIYPHYTVALDSNATIESTNSTIKTKTLTPIEYKQTVLPAGMNVTLTCKKNKAILTLIDQYNTDIPVSIGNANKIEIPCDLSTAPSLMWVYDDDYKIKSNNVKPINNKAFSIVPFNTNNIGDGKVTGVSTDGNLTRITVNKSRYFDNPQFFATIAGKMYFVQSTSDDNVFTIDAANIQKLLITDKTGQLISSIEFPSYE